MIEILIAAMAATQPKPVDMARFLECVKQVEGHAWRDPGGAYGIRTKAWRQHTPLPYALASDPFYAFAWAREHVSWLTASLRKEGYAPTPYALAGCWKLGLQGYLRHRGPVDYAVRVQNLYESTHLLPP